MKIKDNLFIRFFHNRKKRLSACEITIMKDEPVKFVGKAKCHEGDEFVKTKGRNLSLIRAIKQADAELTRPDRIAIWQSLTSSGVHMY